MSRFLFRALIEYLAVTCWSWVQISPWAKNIIFERHFEDLLLWWNIENSHWNAVGNLALQIWSAEMKNNSELEHIQNKSIKPQKVLHHALYSDFSVLLYLTRWTICFLWVFVSFTEQWYLIAISTTFQSKQTLGTLLLFMGPSIYLVDQKLGFDPVFGIWPNFWEKSQFLGFATSQTRYRGKRLPLRYYKPSRWLKTLWGMVHEKLWGVHNYFLCKHLLKMETVIFLNS